MARRSPQRERSEWRAKVMPPLEDLGDHGLDPVQEVEWAAPSLQYGAAVSTRNLRIACRLEPVRGPPDQQARLTESLNRSRTLHWGSHAYNPIMTSLGRVPRSAPDGEGRTSGEGRVRHFGPGG
jgi:hypothetical protein